VSESKPRRRPVKVNAERLWLLRVEQGLSQVQLAGRVGVSKKHISNIEAGRVGASPEVLRRIAATLGCTVADLLITPQVAA